MGFVQPGRDSYGRLRGYNPRSKRPTTTPIIRGNVRRALTVLPRGSSRLNSPNARPERPAAAFEKLPTELQHHIFLLALNPALAAITRANTKTLSGRHLQLSFIKEQTKRGSQEELGKCFRRRFFKREVLEEYEKWAGESLDCEGTCIPPTMVGPPWRDCDLELAVMLKERGALVEIDEMDLWKENMLDALIMAKWDVIALMAEVGVSVDRGCLRLAVKYEFARAKKEGRREGKGKRTVRDDEIGETPEERCEWLVERGCDPGDVRVWKNALGAKQDEGGREALEWLMANAVPPAEILGDLVRRG